RNLKLGRGDTQGATRLALFVLASTMLDWLLRAKHHVAPAEYDRALLALGDSLCTAGAFGVLYLALEPYVRRRWPQLLIGWTRLVTNGLRDPMAAGQCLIGIAMGMASSVLFYLQYLLLEPKGSVQYGAVAFSLDWLMGVRHMLAKIAVTVPYSIGIGLFYVFL